MDTLDSLEFDFTLFSSSLFFLGFEFAYNFSYCSYKINELWLIWLLFLFLASFKL